MCELSVYRIVDGRKEPVMEGVVRLRVSGSKVIMEGILGEAKEVDGRIIEVSISTQEALLLPA